MSTNPLKCENCERIRKILKKTKEYFIRYEGPDLSCEEILKIHNKTLERINLIISMCVIQEYVENTKQQTRW